MRVFQDIELEVTEQALAFRNARLALTFASQTGAWTGLAPANGAPLLGDAACAAALDVEVDGEWLVTARGSVLERYEVRADPAAASATLCMTLAVGESGWLTHTVTLTAGAQRVARSARWTSTAPAGSRLTRFRLALPGLNLGVRDPVLDAPGPFPYWDHDAGPRQFIPLDLLIADLACDRDYPFFSAPDTGFGLLSLSRPGDEPPLCVAAWMSTGGETGYQPVVTRHEDSVTFAFLEERAVRLAPRLAVASGVQHLAVTGKLPGALRAYRDDLARTLPPLESGAAVDWAREMALLEAMPAYFADRGAAAAPSAFQALAERLPFYRGVGFTAIHLMPHWKGGYSPIDFYAVEPSFGTPDDLRAMIDTAHRLGMRVLFDLVIHGFNEASPVLSQRPDLFFRDAAGHLARHPVWRSVSTDWAGPAYQAYMADLARFNLREYDIDGYRVDAAGFKGPNWDPALPYPAYLSGTAAANVIGAMLHAMRETKPSAVMLNEVFGPGFYTVCDLAHDNMTMGPQLFLERLATDEVTAWTYKAHLANVRDALPAGAGDRRVYFARNHDTSWFYHFNGYTPQFLALDAIHAFFGIPEVFAGDAKHGPNPDAAVWEVYRALFAARRRYPELTRGQVALREVEVDNPMVFAGARWTAAAGSLVLVSLSDREETTLVRAPARQWGAQGELVWFDVISGQTASVTPVGADGWDVRLAPCQVVLGRWRAQTASVVHSEGHLLDDSQRWHGVVPYSPEVNSQFTLNQHERVQRRPDE